MHDSLLLPPLIEEIETNFPSEKIGCCCGDKAYNSKPIADFLEDHSIENNTIPQDSPTDPKEKKRIKKLNSKRALIETKFGVATQHLGLEQVRVRGTDAVTFDTILIFMALLCLNIVAKKIGREDKINCPTFFFG